MIRTIVVDDEEPSREALCTYIRDYCTDLDIVAECDCVKSAYKAIQEFNPQLVFLDIEMPKGNGFDLLKLFDPPEFKVIFVTAFSEYAIKAFRFSAIDYLLKPVKVDELIEAVNKTKSEIELKHSYDLNIQTLLTHITDPVNFNSLVIPDLKGFRVINLSDILMCEADAYCTIFYLQGNTKITSSKNLKHYEEFLKEYQFIRVNRSFIVNIQHVKGYSHQGDIFMAEKLVCPLGDSYKAQFLRIFNSMK